MSARLHFGFGPLRFNVPLGRKRRSGRPRKPKKPISRVGLVFCIVFGISFALFEHFRPHETEPVSRITQPNNWPLTVDSGVLSCKGATILFTSGGVTYTQDPLPGDGYSPIKLITADTASEYPDVVMFLSEGEHLC